MAEQQFKLEVPAQIKEVAEKTIDQAERSFHAFIEAANKSVSMLPNGGNHFGADGNGQVVVSGHRCILM